MTPNSYLSPKPIRIIIWIIFSAKLLNALVVILTASEPSIKLPYFWIYIPDVILGAILVTVFHRGALYTKVIWRIIWIFYTFLPLIVEATISYPLNSGLYFWVPLVVGLAGLILLDPVSEYKYIQAIVIASTVISLLGLLLHEQIAFVPPNPIFTSLLRYSLLVLGGTFGTLFVVKRNREYLIRILSLSKEQEESIQRQEQLMHAFVQEKAEAEKRKAAVEAALQEMLHLQAEERRRAEREAFFAQYETLMRTAYTEPLPTFLRKLLEALHQHLPMLGAVTYLRQGDAWTVQATYALKPSTATFPNQGLLATAAHLKKPYLITPPPKGTPIPSVSLHQPQPAALLYLPFFAEATQETVGLAELLLLEVPSDALLDWIAVLLPRIGTYLWVRQLQRTPLPSQASA